MFLWSYICPSCRALLPRPAWQPFSLVVRLGLRWRVWTALITFACSHSNSRHQYLPELRLNHFGMTGVSHSQQPQHATSKAKFTTDIIPLTLELYSWHDLRKCILGMWTTYCILLPLSAHRNYQLWRMQPEGQDTLTFPRAHGTIPIR